MMHIAAERRFLELDAAEWLILLTGVSLAGLILVIMI
jgi:hypothetical protein